MESFLRKAEAISVIGVINDLFLKPLEHMEFARHFPKYEYQNLAILSYESVSCGVPLTISLGTCADYQGATYDSPIGTGIGQSAERLLNKLPDIKHLFNKHRINIAVNIDVSDAESADLVLRDKLSVPPQEFIRLTRLSQDSIRTEATRHGFSGNVRVSSILDKCQEANLDYSEKSSQLRRQFFEREARDIKCKRLIAGLIDERKSKGEYATIPSEEYELMAIAELAAYAVYGELVGPDALICSPHAKSAVMAYNLLKDDQDTISPTLYIGDSPKEKRSLFED